VVIKQSSQRAAIGIKSVEVGSSETVPVRARREASVTLLYVIGVTLHRSP
jgi:hypothetical protein